MSSYEERPARPAAEGGESAPAERPAYRSDRPYQPRPYQGGGDRPPYQGGGDRPERPPYQGGGDRPAFQGGGDRPYGRRPSGPGGSGPRSFGGPRGGGPRRRRQKVSKFDEWGIETINYKEVERLKEFLSEHAKILSRRVTGSRAKHQRSLTRAIKRARYMALLPYVGKIEKHR
jgi:small subunit ribosomal protein S18